MMASLMFEVEKGMGEEAKRDRVKGANFDEVLYADDTICLSTNKNALQSFLHAIQLESAKYGLKLKRTPCLL